MVDIKGYFSCDDCWAEFEEDDAIEEIVCEHSFPICPNCHSANLTWNEGSLDIEGDEKMSEENVNLVEEETGETTQEPQYVNGLFCFHAVSEDRTQRFCTYRLYRENIDPQLVAQDASDWFRIQMRISEVNEKFSLVITYIC